MKIMVTGGGCEEPIDGVRSICNFSSGNTAASLCDHLASRNLSVTAVFSQRAVKPRQPVDLHIYRTFQDLNQILQKILGEQSFDLIIHAAAVSDFGIDTVIINSVEYPAGSVGKMESGSEVLIRLKENPKIIDNLFSWSMNKKCRTVGFKLTNGASLEQREDAVLALLQRTGVNYAVSNDLSEITEDRHPVRIYRMDNDNGLQCEFEGHTKQELADFLLNIANDIQGENV